MDAAARAGLSRRSRYNPVLAQFVYAHALELFKRKLGEGDVPSAAGTGAGETKH